LQAKVFYRDHWLCRWCNKPVVFAPALKYLQQYLKDAGFDGLAYWRYAYDRRGAPLLDELAAVLDHVKAFSVGGPDEAQNLVTSCNRCNIRKNSTDAEKFEREHPIKRIRSKYGEPVDWDGVLSLFVFLAQKYRAGLAPSETEWVDALMRARPTPKLFPTWGQN
jgi:hypothetical protein